MVRSILAAFLFSFVFGSSALAQSCSVPNTLANGTNADATQVMANLNAILACVNNQAAPRSYLAGLTLSTAGSSASFGIAAGVATSDDATTSMKLATSNTKTTGAWALGSGNGSLDTGSIAATPTWYHVFLIERTDTGVVDVLISLNPTSPTLPTSYTKKRRIGSMKTNASAQWIKFSQLGDEFLWDTPVQDASAITLTTTATTLTCTVPTNVQVFAIIDISSYPAATIFFNVTSFDVADYLPSVSNFDYLSIAGANGQFYGQIRTNTSAQFRLRASASAATTYVNTRGWIDRRGRDS